MTEKKEGSAQVIMLCVAGMITVLILLMLGLTQLHAEYATQRLNESVREAVMASDCPDQNAASAYGYTFLDCSPGTDSHCTHETCRYGTMEQEQAFREAYEKAGTRFRQALSASLGFGNNMSVGKYTPCGIKKAEIRDFRTYNVMTGNMEGKKIYELTAHGGIWHEGEKKVYAPDGSMVTASGVYVEICFTVRTYMKTMEIPVKFFAGIRQEETGQ